MWANLWYSERWWPLGPKYVKAYGTITVDLKNYVHCAQSIYMNITTKLPVDVWVVDSCSEGKFWWLKGVIWGEESISKYISQASSHQNAPFLTQLPVGKWMLRKKTPPSNGESEGPGRILYFRRILLVSILRNFFMIIPRIVACQWNGSSPTGPALHWLGGSLLMSFSSLLILFKAMICKYQITELGSLSFNWENAKKNSGNICPVQWKLVLWFCVAALHPFSMLCNWQMTDQFAWEQTRKG